MEHPLGGAQGDTIIPEAIQGIQAWDRYAYVNNNPILYNDPSGHCYGFLLPLCWAVATSVSENVSVVVALAVGASLLASDTVQTSEPIEPANLVEWVDNAENIGSDLFAHGLDGITSGSEFLGTLPEDFRIVPIPKVLAAEGIFTAMNVLGLDISDFLEFIINPPPGIFMTLPDSVLPIPTPAPSSTPEPVSPHPQTTTGGPDTTPFPTHDYPVPTIIVPQPLKPY